MIIVENDDDSYLSWLESNPDGFVVNAENPPRVASTRLHRATCRHISTPERSNWTTTGYIKVCSNLIDELKQWAKGTVGEVAPCGVCKPLVQVAFETPTTPIAVSSTPLPFDSYPDGGRKLLGRRSVTNSRRGYGLELRKLTNQTCCVYCGLDIYVSYENWLLLQVDHVIPTTVGKRLGIPSDWMEDYSNLVLACSGCNTFANQFDDMTIQDSPRTTEEFHALRDRVFLARKPIIEEYQRKEREFFDSAPWSR
ncbi:MAG: HNH endonuclease signature motif containing protein [Planctomycetaceae bacterium]